ncbi:MAG: hypothetical protein ABI867_35190 [Kofleriaceae bacterium]
MIALLVMAATAHAGPSVAILGVEAIDHGVEAAADKLTAGIREHAGKRGARYESKIRAKPIRDAIVTAECKVMQATCATAVGTALGVDFVIAGELTKRGTHQVLVLALFDIHRKQRIRSVRDTTAATADAKKWGRAMYDRLVAESVGELVITANARTGEILLDGVIAATLFEGRATIGGVAPGEHQLVVRARGYKPFEIEVSVDGTTKQALLLDPTQ